MEFRPTKLAGCYLIDSGVFCDQRGYFTKLYQERVYLEHGISTVFKEQFFTLSHKNVLRGMHFLLPPHDQCKLVTCLSGHVIDVVLDLRKNSLTYGQAEFFDLIGGSGQSIFIPTGMAHGFLSLEENSGMMYSTSTVHSPDYDRGILWNSFGFCWPCKAPVISDRDRTLPRFDKFKNPF